VPFDDEDEALMRAFATSAAIAVVTADSVERSRLRTAIAAAEAERGRWARELHDETLQALGSLLVLLGGAAAAGDDTQLRAAVGEAVERVADEVANLRSIIAELRPAALDELGLGPALRALARRAAGGAGLEAAVDVGAIGENGNRLAGELETAVYRVAQEALANVTKHATATRVEMRLEVDGDALALTVADDGIGFDQESSSPRGFGLAGMRERVALAGGTLAVDGGSGGGTVLRATFPVGQPRSSSSSPRSSA
jgi:signal transduction histidine kinase